MDGSERDAMDGRAGKARRAEHIATAPEFRELVRRRSRFAWLLTAAMLVIYFGYILLIAFDPDFLAQPVAGGTTSIGIPIGIGVILAGILLTALYVRRANREYDRLTRALRERLGE